MLQKSFLIRPIYPHNSLSCATPTNNYTYISHENTLQTKPNIINCTGHLTVSCNSKIPKISDRLWRPIPQKPRSPLKHLQSTSHPSPPSPQQSGAPYRPPKNPNSIITARLVQPGRPASRVAFHSGVARRPVAAFSAPPPSTSGGEDVFVVAPGGTLFTRQTTLKWQTSASAVRAMRPDAPPCPAIWPRS